MVSRGRELQEDYCISVMEVIQGSGSIKRDGRSSGNEAGQLGYERITKVHFCLQKSLFYILFVSGLLKTCCAIPILKHKLNIKAHRKHFCIAAEFYILSNNN